MPRSTSHTILLEQWRLRQQQRWVLLRMLLGQAAADIENAELDNTAVAVPLRQVARH